MANMKYCPSCKRNVNTEHGWNTAVLVGLIILCLSWQNKGLVQFQEQDVMVLLIFLLYKMLVLLDTYEFPPLCNHI